MAADAGEMARHHAPEKLVNQARHGLARIQHAAAYLRLSPFDTSTQDGRAAERNRRAAWSTLASMAARLVGLLVSLLIIPLAIGYLGAERYGVWVTISALTALLTFADFGLGNGLLNAVADAHGRDDRDAARRAVSSAFVILTTMAVVALAGFAVIYQIVPWDAVTNASTNEAAAEAGPTVMVFFVCFAVNLPLGLVQRIQYGYQEGFIVSLWTALGTLVSLAGLVTAIQLRAGLPWLVLALAGGPVVATALNGVVLFSRRHPDLRPRLRLATGSASISLVRVGLLFFVLQLAVAVAYQSDVVVAAQIIGPAAAAEYSVTLRLFFLVPMLLSMVFLPLWPAYGEAIARGDLAWVRRTLRRTTALGVAATTGSSAFLVLAGREVLRAWLGPVFDPPFMMLLGMGLWAIVNTAFSSIAMLLNGATVVRFQVVVASIMAATSIVASIMLARQFGVTGIIWGTLLAYLAVAAVPTLWYLPRVFRHLDGRVSQNRLAMTKPGVG
jgi:O-antigen/teichoic acid export membrane protein